LRAREVATARGEICNMPSIKGRITWGGERPPLRTKDLFRSLLSGQNTRPHQREVLRQSQKVPSFIDNTPEPFLHAFKEQEHLISPQNNKVLNAGKRCSGNLPCRLPANIHFLAALCVWRGLLFSLRKKKEFFTK